MMSNANVRSTSFNHRASRHLCTRDVEIILEHQHVNGAYPASPTFPPYRYAWFRDGAFIAYAMDMAGQHESARRFHAWAVEVILRHGEKARRAVTKAHAGQPLGADYLHARYTLEGEEVGDDWPNFQLDGFGTWLWALGEHVRRTGFTLPLRWQEAVILVADYLAALWRVPCYDLWEENGAHVHAYTLAALYAGLGSAKMLTGRTWADEVRKIRNTLLMSSVPTGYFSKVLPPSRERPLESQIDASLVAISVPYAVVPLHSPRMRRTVMYIEKLLWRPGGGVYRYIGDRYYGGGEWILLAAWLGWYYVNLREHKKAQILLRWIEHHADAYGYLPEQVTDHVQYPAYRLLWEQRWGPAARPLLWSHAMHLVLCMLL